MDIGYDDEDEEEYTHQEEEVSERTISAVPTLKYYQRTYAASLGDNDQKAVGVFKQYEAQEKLRRLQNELMQIKTGLVREEILNAVVGKKRKSKYLSYERWAELMLLWIQTAKS